MREKQETNHEEEDFGCHFFIFLAQISREKLLAPENRKNKHSHTRSDNVGTAIFIHKTFYKFLSLTYVKSLLKKNKEIGKDSIKYNDHKHHDRISKAAC